jgi:DAPG hydrolase PhiG domain
MTAYQPTDADRAPLPTSYSSEPRYLGYQDEERTRPFAHFFRDHTLPIQDHVRDALLAGMAPAECGYDIDEAARILQKPGYGKAETGWTRLPGGVTYIAALTDMPGVTAAMWDWWFAWHSTDTARYKLWHPDAHQYSALGQDRGADRTLTDRQRYIGNVSYVDEYIGGLRMRLAIRFLDPAALGFQEAPGTTTICARTTYSDLPVAAGWLIHQVRPTDHGSEMRSRFFINHPELLDLPAHALPRNARTRALNNPAARTLLTPLLPRVSHRLVPRTIGHDLLFHCASEMNHLASFLPELYEQFHNTP